MRQSKVVCIRCVNFAGNATLGTMSSLPICGSGMKSAFYAKAQVPEINSRFLLVVILVLNLLTVSLSFQNYNSLVGLHE